MTAMETEDLAVVTGPLKLSGSEPGGVYLEDGEVVRVIVPEDGEGDALVFGLSTEREQYIDAESLTPLSEIHADPDINWGEVHDYVYEGDE